jgi:hypothetical protein
MLMMSTQMAESFSQLARDRGVRLYQQRVSARRCGLLRAVCGRLAQMRDARTSSAAHPAPAWRVAHAASGVTTALLIAYLEREAGRDAITETLAQAAPV